MSAAWGSLRPDPGRLFCELLPRYFPGLTPADPQASKPSKGSGKAVSQAPPTWASSEQAQEAQAWATAFSRAAVGGGGVIGGALPAVEPQKALEARRARYSLAQLQQLREAAGGAAQSSVVPTEAALRLRLASTPENFLGEVGLGLHLAAASLSTASRPPATPCQRPQPQNTTREAPIPASNVATTEEKRIFVEVVAPELDRSLEDVRSELINHYVGLRGSVVRTGNVAPLVYELNFTCSRCSSEVILPSSEGRFDFPGSCPKRCRFARFNLNRDKCKAIDWQRIRLQEDFAELSTGSGPPRRMPRNVECHLKRSLVGSCVPGDAVTLYGIVRAMPTSGGMAKGGEGKQGPNRALFVLYLEVHAIVNARKSDVGGSSSSTSNPEEFTPLQLSFIREVHQERERFPLLVASFCPHIYGQILAKAALLLALLGGVAIREPGAEQRLRRRGDIHVLLLGDPGLGKSELLRALAKLSHRGVYVSGNSSSVAGLTASVVRDASGEFALEAGALILADNGLCCIDEFDKMGADQQALLEAMEQQTVSIAKAGIVCTLPARTTVVAAANPSKGSWDMSATLQQNMKGVMTEALLSRFDVAFLMRDEENSKQDTALARHITRRRTDGGASQDAAAGVVDWANTAGSERGQKQADLAERCLAQVSKDGLPTELLVTYLRYAKRYAQPGLSVAARARIKEFYLSRRAADHSAGGQLPVTARQLEAVIRLSEARARAELRRVVLRSDVEDVIQILEAGLADMEEMLPRVAQRKNKTPLNKLIERLRQGIEMRARRGQNEFTERTLRQLAGEGTPPSEFDKALQRLNGDEGVLLLTQTGAYRYHGAC